MEDILKPSIATLKTGALPQFLINTKGSPNFLRKYNKKISPKLAAKYAQGGVVGGLMDLSNQSRQMADGLRNMTTGSSGGGIMGGMSSLPILDRAIPSSQTPQLSLGDMTSLGFPTPQYMPMETGQGVDQFGRYGKPVR